MSDRLKANLNRAPTARSRSERNIAVVGGAGFLGSHMCRRLVGEGHRVFCFDNFHTGRADNVADLLTSSRFEVAEHDILAPLPQRAPTFDQIYNFACPASPVHYQENRVRTAKICFQGALNCLDRAARDNARLFHASTSEIYGDPLVHPQREDYHGDVNTVGPRSCYDEGKRIAETLITDYSSQYGVDGRMARIFNTYGPCMQEDDGRVVSNFVVQALQGEDLTVYGAGEQTRSFCYVDDLIEGISRLMSRAEPLSGPVNLGNPEETTVGELAHLVIRLTGSRSAITRKPLPIDDPRRRRPDITKAQGDLNWAPTVPLRVGLERTIAYFEGQIAQRESRALQVSA